MGEEPWSGGRVAVVHDWFQGYHGAERVVEALADIVFFDAARVDVMTFHAAHELLPPKLSSRIVRESRLGRLPGIRQVGHDPGRWRYLLPYMPHYFRSLPLEGYDLVVASSHACAIQANPPRSVPYLCYSHTPMRYAWMGELEAERLGGPRGAALRAAAGAFRRADRRAAARPDALVANSTAVGERIRRFYGRDAIVVHPPVDTSRLAPGKKEPGHFLWVGRLVAYKRPQLAVEALRGMKDARLTMIGIGPLERAIKADLPANVELRGWLSRAELAALYARTSGLLHTAEEDFGMSMVEALAAGAPVVAPAVGGAADIVRDGVDGILVDAGTPQAFREALARVGAQRWDEDSLVERAGAFAPAAFARRMREAASAVMIGGRNAVAPAAERARAQ